jgi:photosystem II stability/assembly factor-like uncharacterized protein
MKWMPIAMIACCAIPVTTALFLGGGIGAWFGRSSQQATSDRSISQSSTQPTNVDASLEKAVNWQANNHVHGLAVNPDNPQVLYVASHNGLLKRSETGEWFWMEPEKERADYMGFTAHPTDSQRFYASGHPHSGGNLGFQITENQGRNWKQISLPGVDLHAMAIAPSNPNVFYGWPASGARGLHVSTDGGKTWTQPLMAGLRAAPFSLAVDPVNPDRVFATTRLGLYQSTNSGSNWALVPNTQDAPIIGLALENQGEITVMYGYRFLKSSPGLYRSRDGGKTWEKLGNGTKGTIVYMAIAPSKPQILYAINDRNTLFQSPDGGKTWKQLV